MREIDKNPGKRSFSYSGRRASTLLSNCRRRSDGRLMLLLGLLFIAVAVIPTLLAGCSGTGEKAAAKEQSLYDRVMKQGKIRCGYVVYTPGCLKDPNTRELSGIGVDAIRMVAKNLGLEVEFTEEVGWGSMIEGLITNRYDMVGTPIWTNANRARQVDFSNSLFYSPIFVYVKKGDTRFKGKTIEQLNSKDISIATIDGETAEIIAREDCPLAKTVSLPQLTDLSQLLLSVSTGKADLTFMEPASAAAYIKNNPDAVEVLKMDKPVRVFPNCWMFKRGEMEFKNMLDTALSQVIYSGGIDRIVSKYEPVPGSLYRNALPYRIPQSRAEAAAK